MTTPLAALLRQLRHDARLTLQDVATAADDDDDAFERVKKEILDMIVEEINRF